MRVLLCLALALALTASSKPHRGCFDDAELETHGKQLLRRQLLRSGFRSVQLPSAFQQTEPRKHTCDSFKLKRSSADFRKRALSPWRYRVDLDDSRYPPAIAVAECLCEGCIIDGVEDFGYSSQLLTQTVMVAKYSVCPSDPHKYSVQYSPLEIGVGCTCVVPRS